jgi:hypothetical protein
MGISLVLSPDWEVPVGSRSPVPQSILLPARRPVLPKIPQGSPCGKGHDATTLRPVKCRCPYPCRCRSGGVSAATTMGPGSSSRERPLWGAGGDNPKSDALTSRGGFCLDNEKTARSPFASPFTVEIGYALTDA